MGLLDGFVGGVIGAGLVSVVSVQDLTQKLSQVLPQIVDGLTPNGSLPKS